MSDPPTGCLFAPGRTLGLVLGCAACSGFPGQAVCVLAEAVTCVPDNAQEPTDRAAAPGSAQFETALVRHRSVTAQRLSGAIERPCFRYRVLPSAKA